MASGFTPFGSTPADATSKSAPPMEPSKASAIWLRALLPVQTEDPGRRTHPGTAAFVARMIAEDMPAVSVRVGVMEMS